jgi:uncharacterized protein YegP (UPF0339 family)
MADTIYPNYWMRKDDRGEWRWTYYAKNAEPISVSSEGYKNMQDCQHSISLMKGSKDDKVYYTE